MTTDSPGAAPDRRSVRSRFLWTLAGLVVLTLWAAAVVTPPDPLSQLLVLVSGLVLAAALAYWLAVRDG